MKFRKFHLAAIIITILPVFLLASCSDHNKKTHSLSSEVPWLGVKVKNLTPGYLKSIDQKYGVKITQVLDESPAEEAGLQEEDILLTFREKVLDDRDELMDLVQDSDIDDTVDITLLRDGKTQTKSVKIGSRETTRRYSRNFRWDRDHERSAKRERSAWMGVSTESLTDQLRTYFNVPGDAGVLVTRISEDSPAEEAGLQAGDVIIKVDGTTIHDHSRLVREIRSFDPGEEVQVTIIRKGVEESLKIKLGEAPSKRHRYYSYGDGDFHFEIPDIDVQIPDFDAGEIEELKRDLHENLEDSREELQEAMEELRDNLHDIKIEINSELSSSI